VIAFKDGEFDEAEQEMFSDYLEMLEITEQKNDIMYLSTALINKDIDLALSFYTAKKEMFEKYDYMFDMMDIDIEKELKAIFSYKWTIWETQSYGSIKKNRSISLTAESVQNISIFLNSRIINGAFERRTGTTRYFHNDIEVVGDNDINNLSLVDGLYSYQSDKNELIIFTRQMKHIIIDLYIEWLNNYINHEITRMEVHLSYSSSSSDGDKKILFKSNCAGKPDTSVYELCFGSFGSSRANETIFNNQVFYEDGNFGDNANDYTKKANPTEFTFRLMKIQGE